MNNNLNLIGTVLLSIAIIMGWQYFYERPKLAALASQHQNYNQKMQEVKSKSSVAAAIEEVILERTHAISDSNRIKISTPHLNGSISLKGLRFDDLTLADYKQGVEPNSPEVELLSPSSTKNSYFAELGWHSDSPNIDLPDSNTVWKADKGSIEAGNPVRFSWINKDKVEFVVKVSIDEYYMFSVEQAIINNSANPIAVRPYGLINRTYEPKESASNILHEGPIATMAGTLEDVTYETIKDKKSKRFSESKLDWMGITDKYWLTALIPDQRYQYSSNFTYDIHNGQDRYQTDYIGQQYVIDSGKSLELDTRFFTGAKKVNLLDEYSEKYDIKLFDRAIDFGMFYILTKPLFHALNFFYKYFGNFGVSILMVTVIIKLLMFGIANKSYRSMKKMKALQPEIDRIKSLYGEDKTKFNQEIMELYKREKVNPVSGCLPLLVQIPVFFSIYKVLYVTIEMRHAPFYGWIRDLSAPDPTTIFNLFGLIDFTPPAVLMIGVWPLLMALTMYLQQKMSPQPADPVQASVMKFMPLLFLVMFSRFPAGLLIYWAWNNILSIVQQYSINKLDKGA